MSAWIFICGCRAQNCISGQNQQKMIKYLRDSARSERYPKMSSISRRKMLKSTLAGTALASGVPMASSLSWGQEKPSASPETPMPRKGNIHQSVSRWCYAQMSLDELCAYAAQIGLKGVDLLEPKDFETPKKYGLICTMGYVDAG